MKTIALDPGNYQLKICDGAQPRSIRSVQYRLPRGLQPLKALKNSPIVEFEGERWHVGSQAFKYASQQQTLLEDKAQLAKLHFYASLENTSGDISLIVSHHSPKQYKGTLESLLAGTHSFKRNGIEMNVNVRSIEVVPEGMGSYWLAQRQGFIPDTGYTIIVDIGGSSWIFRVVDDEGDIVDESVGDRFGSYDLAKQLSQDDRLKTPLRSFGITAPDAGAILDGFTRGHTYEETRISWAEWLEEYRNPWFKRIFGTVSTACTPHMPKTRRILVCGGGAHLIEHKLRGKMPFVVMPSPEYANVLGMFSRFATPARLEVA